MAPSRGQPRAITTKFNRNQISIARRQMLPLLGQSTLSSAETRALHCVYGILGWLLLACVGTNLLSCLECSISRPPSIEHTDQLDVDQLHDLPRTCTNVHWRSSRHGRSSTCVCCMLHYLYWGKHWTRVAEQLCGSVRSSMHPELGKQWHHRYGQWSRVRCCNCFRERIIHGLHAGRFTGWTCHRSSARRHTFAILGDGEPYSGSHHPGCIISSSSLRSSFLRQV